MQQAVQEHSFRTLLYRYFFFEWLFKNAGQGDIFERAAAWRHNRDASRWLPLYMKRWTILGALFYGMGAFFELLMQLPVISAFFYVPSTLAFPVNAVIGVAWLGFKMLPPPL